MAPTPTRLGATPARPPPSPVPSRPPPARPATLADTLAESALGGGPLGRALTWLARQHAQRLPAQPAAWQPAPHRPRAAVRGAPAPDVLPSFPVPQPLTLVGPPLPRELTGTLYLNGPGAFASPDGQRYASHLDGDGMPCAMHLAPTGCSFVSRFVDTAARRIEARAGRRCFGGVAHVVPGGIFGLLRGRGLKNAANTSLAYVDGRLIAHYEGGGQPYELDPDTLETLGQYDLDGALGAGAAFSAHPKLGPDGELVNFGVHHGTTSYVRCYVKPPGGRGRCVARVAAPYRAPLHDGALLAGPGGRLALLLCHSPAVIDWPAARRVLRAQIPPLQAVAWEPERGSHVDVIDLATGRRSAHYHLPTLGFAQHVVNAWHDGEGGHVLDVCAFRDFDFVAATLAPDAEDGARQPVPAAALLRVQLRPGAPARVTPLCDAGIEYPCIDPRERGQPTRTVFGNAYVGGQLPDCPSRVDVVSGRVVRARLRPCEAAGACAVVPKAEGRGVWLLTVVTDVATGCGALRIYDGEKLAGPPRNSLALPPGCDVSRHFHALHVPCVGGVRQPAVP